MKRRNPRLYKSELEAMRSRWERNRRAKLREEDQSLSGRWHMVREHVDAAREEARIMERELPRHTFALQFLLFVATIAADWGFRKFAAWLGAVAIKEPRNLQSN